MPTHPATGTATDIGIEAIGAAGEPLPARRFPAPWSVVEQGESFHVRDATGQILGYFCFEDEPSRRSNLNRLTRDEARRIASNVAKLRDVLNK